MILDLWVGQQKLDLFTDLNIKHSIQANDIAELADRQASFTNAFDVPKTANNVQIMQGLGLSGDTSRIPYEKPVCKMKLDGFDFIVKGWLNVKETKNVYKIYIYSGIIAFFKAIENKTFAHLNLSELDHDRTPASVVASFSNTTYKYLIGDYGGDFLTDTNKVNTDYLVPSVNAKYLWDKIHETFGFAYSGSVFQDLSTRWMTYPKVKNITDNVVLQGEAEYKTTNSKIVRLSPWPIYDDRQYHYFVADTKNAVHGSWLQHTALMPGIQSFGHFQVASTGYFKVVITGNVVMPAYGGGFVPGVRILHLLKNVQGYSPKEAILQKPNVIKTKILAPEPDFNVSYEAVIQLQAGDTLTLALEHNYNDPDFDTDAEIKIYKVENEVISFTEELKNLPIKSFIKDIFNLYSLTPFTDEFSNEIQYKTLDERLNAPVVNWSHKFIERTSETYVYNNYAQKNIFRYKYNSKDANYNDGAIYIDNKNLNESNIFYDSMFYSPEKELVDLTIGANTYKSHTYFMWERGVNKNNQLEYKAKDNRFFLIGEQKINAPIELESGLSGQTASAASFPMTNFTGVSIQDYLDKYYSGFKQLIDDSRIHKIELYINPIDLLQLDLQKIYYFEQEAQYYVLNNLQYDYKTERATGEFVRTKHEIGYAAPVIDFQILWDDNTTETKVVGDAVTFATMKFGSFIYDPADEPQELDWEYFDGNYWASLGTDVSPSTFPLQQGFQSFRLKVTTLKNNVYYSNSLRIKQGTQVCKSYRAWTDSAPFVQVTFTDCSGIQRTLKEFRSNYPQDPTTPIDPQDPTHEYADPNDPQNGGINYGIAIIDFCAIENTVTLSDGAFLDDLGPC